MTRFLIGVFSLLFLSHCGGDLTGKIYLDLNGNNARESTEQLIANLAFTVTKDDEDLTTGTTDSSGNFSVDMDGKGTYCIEVSEAALAGSSVSTVSALVLPQRLEQQTDDNVFVDTVPLLFAESDCSDGEDDDADGDTDCDDSDCSSDSACEDSDDDDSSSDDSSDDSSSDSDSSSTESQKACDDSGGGALKLEVPVAMDYSSGVSSISDPSTKTASRGDTISIDIVYPTSCSFDLLTLDTAVSPVSPPSGSYNSTTGILNLNTVIAASSSSSTSSTTDLDVVNVDSLRTYSLSLEVNNNGDLGDETVTITPKMTCPDDSSLTLKTHTIEIDSDNDFTLTNNVTGNKTYGGSISVATTVTNASSASFTSSQVELSFSGPSFAVNLDYDNDCSDSGESSKCTFALAAGASDSFTTTFTLPATVTSNTTFEMVVTLTITSGGTTVTYTDTVSISLSANASSS